MAKFVYTLKDDKGRDYEGTIEAKDKREAQAALDTKGYYLTSLKKMPQLQLALFSRGITRMEVVVLARQLGTMLGTGLPIIKTLAAIGEQAESETLRTVINDIRTKIEAGFKLSEALEKHPGVFSPFFVSLVRTGETGGILDEMFKRLSTYLEREEDMRRKVKTAFAYPAVVSVVAVGVVSYLVVFVVPIFKSVYAGMKVTLPGPTLALIAMSDAIRKGWWLGLIAIGLLFVGYKLLQRTEKGAYIIDRIKISVPLLGVLNRKAAITRFIRSFGALISSGIPITRALDVSESIAGNKVVTRVVDGMRLAVNRGESISGSLRYGRIFPPIVVQMIAAGEESGALDEMLSKSSDFLDEDVDLIIRRITVKIEPILTISLAVVIGFIALAIYLPMFDIIKQIAR